MTIEKYKTKGNKGLFDEQFTIERLSVIGNPLENDIVNEWMID